MSSSPSQDALTLTLIERRSMAEDHEIAEIPPVLASQEVDEGESSGSGDSGGLAEGSGVCAICLNTILIQETALVKGCEHAYCVTCILRWATYSQRTSCPQCKCQFDYLHVHRSLDGCIHDYMFEESVCLLLRATWFVPLVVEPGSTYEQENDLSQYYYHSYDECDEDSDDDTYYPSSSSSVRIGNRRWGDNGFVSGGRKEARPRTVDQFTSDISTPGTSDVPKKKEAAVAKEVAGRRAKRAMKREAADKAAAAKHKQHLERFGRC